MTPDCVALLRESALRDEVFPKDMVALCDEVDRLRALAAALYQGIGALDDATPGGFGLGGDVPELTAAIEAYETAFPEGGDR